MRQLFPPAGAGDLDTSVRRSRELIDLHFPECLTGEELETNCAVKYLPEAHRELLFIRYVIRERAKVTCRSFDLSPRGYYERLDQAHKKLSGALNQLSGQNTRSHLACPNCWRVWLTGPQSSVGYCWHGRVAWRVRPSGEFITAPGVDKNKHLAIVRALQKRELQGFTAR